MRRIVVLGGLGFFGHAAVLRLGADGVPAVVAGRSRRAELRVDAEDPASLRGALRPGDVVLDTAGPFQYRTTALIEAALAVGCDVVDISDSLGYALRVRSLKPRIDKAGIRVLSSCSASSAVTAAFLRHARVKDPAHLRVWLAPSPKVTANLGMLQSFMASIRRDIQVWREGALATVRGWSAAGSLDLPAPVGRITGRLVETADAAHLPPVCPTLRSIEFRVDTRVTGANLLFRVAAAIPPVRTAIAWTLRPSLSIARLLGAESGGMAAEVFGPTGARTAWALVAPRHGYLVALAPAVLAVRALAEDKFPHRGLVPPHKQVDPDPLWKLLADWGIAMQPLA